MGLVGAGMLRNAAECVPQGCIIPRLFTGGYFQSPIPSPLRLRVSYLRGEWLNKGHKEKNVYSPLF